MPDTAGHSSPLERLSVPPPPLPPSVADPPAFRPYFRGDSPLSRSDPDLEPFEPAPLADSLPNVLQERALEVATAAHKVETRLAGKRYATLGVSRRTAGKELSLIDWPLVVRFYNYTDNIVLEVTLDAGAATVQHVAESRYQPPPVQAEIAAALRLAREEPRMRPHLRDAMYGAVMPQVIADPRSPLQDHRVFDVMFVYPDERAPRCKALVDLSTETVLSVDAPGDDREDDRE